jgi:ABC-type transporter Mla subunit MlaD
MRVILADRDAEIERLTKDAERLAYIYSGQRTTSDALVNLELRLLHGEAVTMDAVRTAIDDAIAAGSQTELEGGRGMKL